MAQQVNLAAASRSQTGTGAARALRRSGQVPAVIYGHGREPEPLAIAEERLEQVAAAGARPVAVDRQAD